MSDKIISTMNMLLDIHQDILELSKRKTERIKEGHIESLQPLIAKERKSIRQLKQIEEKRQQVVHEWSQSVGITHTEPTISEMVHYFDKEKQEELLSLATNLTDTITNLKKQEQLNQLLINESMKFVQLSLDLMSPTLKNMNYGNGLASTDASRSVFDSKA